LSSTLNSLKERFSTWGSGKEFHHCCVTTSLSESHNGPFEQVSPDRQKVGSKLVSQSQEPTEILFHHKQMSKEGSKTRANLGLKKLKLVKI